ncbi:hypothetical protein G7Y89_g8077 [Cudoniella acicularis]|uniref:CENP-T/Histone H4 histone fold domain-containing protein n=1 Tax=Cudoniella acicularis TaxID=354080 RepID=A0A8H4RI51_9HELO|nr:hypothetical protein G7Y89_g8077 [Cudoniella acicularis]
MSAQGRRGAATNKNIERLGAELIRVTPQNSDTEDSISAAKETPYTTLRALANIPRPTTPLRRASSAGPPSTHRSIRRTPTARIPGAGQKNGSGRQPIAVTPHGRAAQRQLEARRAGLTPGKDRRKSGLQQRETPRDTLRALARLLAPKSTAIVPTPEVPKPSISNYSLEGKDDLDDWPELERPRLSLPIGDDDSDDDDSLLLPPRSAGLEDENFTVQSVEIARRAISEQPYSRLSRGSFGSIRLSDRFADLNDLSFDGIAEDSSFMGGIAFGDNVEDLPDDDNMHGDNTETLRDIGFGRGRISDIRPGDILGDDTEDTFVFTVPPRDVSEPRSEDEPERPDPVYEDDQNVMDEEEDEIPDGTEDIDMEEPDSHRTLQTDPHSEMSMLDTTREVDVMSALKHTTARRKMVKVSKHGIQYPSLPVGVVKKLATTYARTAGNGKTKLNKETMDAIMQATDWFFEQVSDDLGAYAKHAGRKTIDESDIVTLMARQRQTNVSNTPFSLAQKHLPRELLQELRMVPPFKLKKGRQLQRVDEDD